MYGCVNLDAYGSDRKDVNVTKEDIWKISHTFNKKERFKAVILHYSVPSISYKSGKNNDKEYEDVIKQWVFCSNVYGGEDHCICSQRIYDNYAIKNNKNGKILIVGSVCIDKLDGYGGTIDLKDSCKLVNKLFRKCEYCRTSVSFDKITGGLCKECYGDDNCNGDFSDNKICHVCLKMINLSGYDKCKSCWKEGRKSNINKIITNNNVEYVKSNIKNCEECGKAIYFDEQYKTYCKECYKIKMRLKNDPSHSKNISSCIDCGENIYNEPEWKIRCISCYIQWKKINI